MHRLRPTATVLALQTSVTTATIAAAGPLYTEARRGPSHFFTKPQSLRTRHTHHSMPMYDANKAMDDRERIFFKNLETDDWDLFVAAIETTDRVSHMMWQSKFASSLSGPLVRTGIHS